MGEQVDFDQTTFPQEALKRSVMKFPSPQEQVVDSRIIFDLFSVASRIEPWGTGYQFRERQLRDFWPTEPFLAGAIYSTSIRNANYEWEITGPDDRVVQSLTDMFNGAITGTNFGWLEFIKAITQDELTQDNGFFIEIIRDETLSPNFKKWQAPVVGVAHLDASRCIRTGNPEWPVLYIDRDEKRHRMHASKIIALSQFPSPIQRMNGIGFCAVSRILKFAEIISSIEIYTDEKVSGRHFKQLHLVSGVSRKDLEDIKRVDQENADNAGLMRYIEPMIYASLDPEKPVTTATIDLASIPDNFDFDTLMRWYIANIALNIGGDYQDFAPLPSGNIGSSSQSEILARKSHGKGPANSMETIENMWRDYGVVPAPYKFKFKVKDLAEEADRAAMLQKISEFLVILRRGDVINGKTARAAMKHFDILPDDILAMTPEEFGNESTLAKTENLVGQVGDSTIGEDARRVQKNVFQRIRDALSE